MSDPQSASRYVALFDLAAGGMGVVSVAQLRGDRGFRKTVAVKRIHPQLASDAQFYELLAREAHVASLIRDPGVVQVHELVEQAGELVLAMELVEGVSLKKLQTAMESAEEPFPIPVAVRILAKVARALHAAHSATDEAGHPLSIVHRDVSPQNVLISFRGDVKVTDFGIAKALAGGEEGTRSSTVRGKPAYLSPEQISGGAVDARSDVWSLGVVAFELIAGKRLFKGRNELETLRLLLEGEIPYMDSLREDVPPALASAVQRALERDASARWSSALDFAQAIEAAVDGAFARRDDVADLIARHLPAEEAAFTERLRGALAAALDATTGPRPIATGIRPKPFRFAGLMATAFAVTLGVRLFAWPMLQERDPEPALGVRASAIGPDDRAAPPAPSGPSAPAAQAAPPVRSAPPVPVSPGGANPTSPTPATAHVPAPVAPVEAVLGPTETPAEPGPDEAGARGDRGRRRERDPSRTSEPRTTRPAVGPGVQQPSPFIPPTPATTPARPAAPARPAPPGRPAYIEDFPL